jgi:hypothetical protein
MLISSISVTIENSRKFVYGGETYLYVGFSSCHEVVRNVRGQRDMGLIIRCIDDPDADGVFHQCHDIGKIQFDHQVATVFFNGFRAYPQ